MNKKTNFFFTVLVILVFNGISSAFAVPELSSAKTRKATEALLSITENVSVDEITKLLLEGANVNGIDDNGLTPLMKAAEGNLNSDVLQVLIENGANVNAVNIYTALNISFASMTKKINKRNNLTIKTVREGIAAPTIIITSRFLIFGQSGTR